MITAVDVCNIRSGYDLRPVDGDMDAARGSRDLPATHRPAAGRHPHTVNRILWNRRGHDIDELVVSDCIVHVEQMDARCWWIGIARADGGWWSGNFVADSRGRMRFMEQEHDGFDWDRDDTHEVTP